MTEASMVASGIPRTSNIAGNTNSDEQRELDEHVCAQNLRARCLRG
jgi:hypothetical protein